MFTCSQDEAERLATDSGDGDNAYAAASADPPTAADPAAAVAAAAGPVGLEQYVQSFRSYINQEQSVKVHEFGT